MIILYGLLWYGSIGCFLYNFNTFTLAEKLTVILVISGINVLSFINTRES
jgi:competence protein ComGC